MASAASIPVLLFDDGLLDATLCQALSGSGFQLLATADVEAGVRLLCAKVKSRWWRSSACRSQTIS
jgi:hypothetical protein